MSGVTVVLLSKPAVVGRVKTRMTSRWTAAEAASLHECLLGDVLEQLAGGVAGSGQCGGYRLEVAWALEALAADEVGAGAPGHLPAHPLLQVPPQVGFCFAQSGSDLGARIHGALAAAVARGAEIVMAVGSDHPELDGELVCAAARALEGGADVAVAPSHDGGYGLLAIRAAALRPELFEQIDWSTEKVFDQTRGRIELAGLRLAVLPMLHDVDRPEDLEALVARLERAADSPVASRTRAWARRHGAEGPVEEEAVS